MNTRTTRETVTFNNPFSLNLCVNLATIREKARDAPPRSNHRGRANRKRTWHCGCSALNFLTHDCALRAEPPSNVQGQAVACPKAAHKTGPTEVSCFLQLAAHVPSEGTVTFQIKLRSARVHQQS